MPEATSPEAASPGPGGTASGHALVLRDVSAGYKGIPVVRDLNLEVRPGEVVALLGPNGAGKTTTLETIAGLNRPITGTIGLSGEAVGGRPAHLLARQGLALVPEGRALFPGLTVREHLRLAGGRASRKGGSSEEELLEMLPELRKCLGRKAGVLSGGEQQMLALGPGAGDPAAAAAGRRDEPGPGPGDRRAAAPDPAPGRPMSSARACCSSSSTWRWRWRSPTAPTS
jgi:ABC-type transport system involved in cytochrome bd biosynthesis fused ATPase/permease subunit